MTQTADRSEAMTSPFAVEPVPRRPLLSRLSLGHLIMVLAGLLAFLLVLAVLRDRGEIVEIAVAAEQIDAGTPLDRSDIRYAAVSDADETLLSALLTPAAIDRAISDGWVATRTLVPGVPLTSSDFRRDAVTSDLRAMSLPISTEHAVNGAIVVGDRIDVIVVRQGIAEYVATDVEVIAVGSSDTSVRSSFALTVAVDDAASLRLAVAINSGAIEVVRSTGAELADPGAIYPPPVVDDTTGG